MVKLNKQKKSPQLLWKSVVAIALSISFFFINGFYYSNLALAQTNNASATTDTAPPSKPNIVVIWGDDIGQSDLSIFTKGLMGFKTPNIDRIAQEGILFTDYYNEIMSHLDWMPTLLAAAGETNIKEKLLNGYRAGRKSYKVHLDGYNFLPYLTGESKDSPRQEYFYFSDDGDLLAMRYDNWKVHFAQQRKEGTLALWGEPFVKTRIPWLYNLRTDPYERASITSNTYWDWYIDHVFLLVPAQSFVGNFLETFKKFPPRQKAASFTIDDALESLQKSPSS